MSGGAKERKKATFLFKTSMLLCLFCSSPSFCTSLIHHLKCPDDLIGQVKSVTPTKHANKFLAELSVEKVIRGKVGQRVVVPFLKGSQAVFKNNHKYRVSLRKGLLCHAEPIEEDGRHKH